MDRYNPDDDWRSRAACKGSTATFFRPDIGSGRPLTAHWSPDAAKAICATCPVRLECLTYAVDAIERHGIWGGAGDDILRGFRRRRRATRDSHADEPGCECAWCHAVATHFAGLNDLAAIKITRPRRAPHRNGPAVTHGKGATYARGCRCSRCKFRVSAAGVRLHDVDVDVATWWTATFGPRHGLSTTPTTTARQCVEARETLIVEVADQITAGLARMMRDPAWLADELADVCPPDIARQLCDRDDVAHLITPTELAKVTDLLGVVPAVLLTGRRAVAA